jgi:hypothetical protein
MLCCTFFQWQPVDFKSVKGEIRDSSSQSAVGWEAGMGSMSLLKSISNNLHLAEGVIGIFRGLSKNYCF